MSESSLVPRIDRWVAEQPVPRQHLIAAVTFVGVTFTIGTVLAVAMLGWLEYIGQGSYSIWWAVAFGGVMSVLALVKERGQVLPEDGFKPPDSSNDSKEETDAE